MTAKSSVARSKISYFTLFLGVNVPETPEASVSSYPIGIYVFIPFYNIK